MVHNRHLLGLCCLRQEWSDVMATDVSAGPNEAGTAEYGPEIPEGAITCKEAPPQFGSKKAGN